MPGKLRVAGPEVLAFAEQCSLDLSTVTGTGTDGRITKDDAFRAAVTDQLGLDRAAPTEEILAVASYVHKQAERRKAAAEQARAEAEQRQAAQAMIQPAGNSIRQRAAARGPAFALNPRVDQIRAQAAAGQANAPTAPPPTLFASGDLPTFTASGIPPEVLLDAPWDARHAMAAAPTTAEAYAILADCQANEGDALEYALHPGNQAYAERVNQWYEASITDEQREAAFAETAVGARVVAFEERTAQASVGESQ